VPPAGLRQRNSYLIIKGCRYLQEATFSRSSLRRQLLQVGGAAQRTGSSLRRQSLMGETPKTALPRLCARQKNIFYAKGLMNKWYRGKHPN